MNRMNFPQPWLAAGLATLALALSAPALAGGTDAGRKVTNSVSAAFKLGGIDQAPQTASESFFVDELLNATVTNQNAGNVTVTSPDADTADVPLVFLVTNTGNGTETFRLVTEDTLTGDTFNPSVTAIFIESNGIPGLQSGGGTPDTLYQQGVNDPTLAKDASVNVYVVSSIPAAVADNGLGNVALRAVATTVITGTGTDDPANGAWPSPGDAFAGAGDLDADGGANVTAVVGTTFDTGALALRDIGTYQISSVSVLITKTAVQYQDPFAGSTKVPGTVVSYRVTVDVNGTGTAEALVISDLLPADLDYVSGSLTVSVTLPAGQNVDDAQTLVDLTGFNTGTRTLTVNLGDVVGGGPDIDIDYQATIR